MSNYVTKEELEHATGFNTFDLATKKDFVDLKAEVEKVDFNKLVNVPNSSNNLKAKVDDLDVDELKKVDLKKLSDIVKNEIKKKQKIKDTENESK